MFLESWSDYSPEDDYEDSYIETPIDYMEVSIMYTQSLTLNLDIRNKI